MRLRRRVYVIFGKLSGPQVVFVIYPNNGAITTEHNIGVVITFTSMVAVFTARYNCSKVSPYINVILNSQATQSRADITIINPFFTGYLPISFWLNIFKKRPVNCILSFK